jgi:hypothetical protein
VHEPVPDTIAGEREREERGGKREGAVRGRERGENERNPKSLYIY